MLIPIQTNVAKINETNNNRNSKLKKSKQKKKDAQI